MLLGLVLCDLFQNESWAVEQLPAFPKYLCFTLTKSLQRMGISDHTRGCLCEAKMLLLLLLLRKEMEYVGI